MRTHSSKLAGFTLLETLTAAFLMTVILASVGAGSIALQKSFVGNRAYMKGSADNSRMIDFVSQDLRNAQKISKRVGGVSTTIKVPADSFEITENEQLSISVPDFYLSNVPDNSEGSAYKTGYFSRSQIGAGRTYFTYDSVVKIDGITRIPNYPATIEVRYQKKARSNTDSTQCYFRMEYEGGTLRRTDEIAEKVELERIRVTVVDKYAFQISSSFASRWTGEASREATRQFSTVKISNYRTDLK